MNLISGCFSFSYPLLIKMFGSYSTGNGNGNKLNLRTEILQGLLASMGDGKNAKVNLLKQTVMRNKTDMAGDAYRSLDLVRQVI